MELAYNVSRLLERVRKACAEAGRSESEVRIVAASKCVDAQTVYKLPSLGITEVGENRVSEFNAKYDGGAPLKWHIIGALQTNKVRYVVGKTAMIQSVDRQSLAETIDRISARAQIVTDVLIEVNIGGEQSKSGVAPEAALEFASQCSELKNLRVRGLMSVPPVGAEYPLYEKMRALFDEMRGSCPYADTLSMGMSGDLETAIKCGATMIRPGRALFGERIVG